MGKKGRAKTRAKVAPKQPKAQPPRSTQDEHPFFCFRYADTRSSHPWAFNPSAADAELLFGFLCQMGQLRWREIESHRAGEHRKHHSQSVSSLEKKAQQYVMQNRLDELFGDEMFRFRIDGKKRLWGFRQDRVFHVVWWDPHHAVYSTEPN